MPIKIEDGILYVYDGNGNPVKFTEIQNIEDVNADPIDEQMYANIAFGTPYSFTLTLSKPVSKGMKDYLFGRAWTSAARRFIRSQKRQKEKQRRMNLKQEVR